MFMWSVNNRTSGCILTTKMNFFLNRGDVGIQNRSRQKTAYFLKIISVYRVEIEILVDCTATVEFITTAVC